MQRSGCLCEFDHYFLQLGVHSFHPVQRELVKFLFARLPDSTLPLSSSTIGEVLRVDERKGDEFVPQVKLIGRADKKGRLLFFVLGLKDSRGSRGVLFAERPWREITN